MITFNLDDGFTESVVRGYRAGILTAADYSNLGQCDGLEGENLKSCVGKKSFPFSRGVQIDC